MTRSIATLTACAISFGALIAGAAEAPASQEKITFAAQTLVEPQTEVRGELSIPAHTSPRVPAVVVVHSAGGIDGTGASYIKALNEAGFATLELDMFRPGQRPPTSRANLPHVFGALLRLASDPRIDAGRIGVMGFSWGGSLALLSASSELSAQFVGDRARFAAHLALYPACFAHAAILAGGSNSYPSSVYQAFTGSPVAILTGANDDYDDDPQACPQFVQSLPAAARSLFHVVVYPGVGHGWDVPRDRRYLDPGAHRGKGGWVQHRSDAATRRQSIAYATAFFQAMESR
jgi:dienelactone hydrolase